MRIVTLVGIIVLGVTSQVAAQPAEPSPPGGEAVPGPEPETSVEPDPEDSSSDAEPEQPTTPVVSVPDAEGPVQSQRPSWSTKGRISSVTAPGFEEAKEPSDEPTSSDSVIIDHARNWLLTVPTGHLLAEGIATTALRVDTGGGVAADIRVGLGNIAEFSIHSNSYARLKRCLDCQRAEIGFMPAASIKMGIGEGRFSKYMPAISLAYQKSFERETEGLRLQHADLSLIVTKSFGDSISITAGGAFFDASIGAEFDDPDDDVTLHQKGFAARIRPTAGLIVRPFDNSYLLADLSWQTDYSANNPDYNVALRPMLTWGVRYVVADWLQIESGVRVPDVQSFNLLDSQIFASVRVFSSHFNRWIQNRKK